MVKIREEQRVALGDNVLREFHNAMEKHIAAFAPERVRVAGPAATAEFVADGIAAARDRGLNQRGPIRCWLEIMVVLGHDFDTDPQYRALLPELDPAMFPMPFAQRLHRNVGRYLDACFGPDRAYLGRAIAGAAEAPVLASGDTAKDVIAGLRLNWPEKLEVTGPEPLRALAATTDEEAARIGLSSPEGRSLMGTLGVCFGAGVLRDPLYPWLHRRLTAESPESDRIEKTLTALKNYASRAAQRLATGG